MAALRRAFRPVYFRKVRLLQWMRRLPQHIVLHVTTRCDLRCRTCFVEKGGRDLSLDDARTIAGKVGRVRWLDIGGGEPFLHPNLLEICGLFNPRDLTIPTNGQRPEKIEAAVRALRANMRGAVTIAVSLDGFAEANDALRGVGAFDRAMGTFKRIRGISGISVKVNTVVCAANIGVLPEFAAHVRDMGADYHSLLLLRGRPADSQLALPPVVELREMFEKVRPVLASYAFQKGRHPFMARLLHSAQQEMLALSMRVLQEDRAAFPCRAPWVHRVIYPDGSVAMCELMPCCGNLLSEDLDSVDARISRAFGRHESEHGACFCTHNCNMAENMMFHPQTMGRVLLGALKRRKPEFAPGEKTGDGA